MVKVRGKARNRLWEGLHGVSKLLQRSWWEGTESNRRHEDFQSSALPTELPSHKKKAFPMREERAKVNINNPDLSMDNPCDKPG